MALTLWRVGNIAWGLLLLLAATVQLNDPDPALWIAAYCIPAGFSAAAVADRLRPMLPAAWSVLALASAIAIAAGGIAESNPMSGPGGLLETGLFAEEVVRESLGLTLIALGSAAQAMLLHKRYSKPEIDG